MVAVLHAAPHAAAPQAVAAWLASLVPDYSADERASFADAFEFARARTGDAAMADGEPALDRALGTATILAGLKLDADSLRAALLLGVPVAGAFDADEIRRALRRRRGHAGRGRRAHGRHPRGARGREQGGARGAGREPAQDAAGDGRGHPRRADQARRAHAGAALADDAATRSGASAPRARCSTSSRRSPTGSASGS